MASRPNIRRKSSNLTTTHVAYITTSLPSCIRMNTKIKAQQKLVGALYGAEPNGPLLADIALQMRIDRFAEKVKINIDKDAYKQWLAATGTQQPRLFPNQHLAQELSGAVRPALYSLGTL